MASLNIYLVGYPAGCSDDDGKLAYFPKAEDFFTAAEAFEILQKALLDGKLNRRRLWR